MPLVIKPEFRDEAFDALNELHDIMPDTECKQRNLCCKAGCPPMYFSEFVYITDYIKKNIDKDTLGDVAVNCMKHYFSEEILKPCPLFNDGCLVYENRPINCRLYGQVPKEEYERRQNRTSDEFTMSAEEMRESLGLGTVEDIPLYEQCPHVKPIEGTGDVITMESFDNIFNKLEEIEVTFLSDIEIDINFTSYKTFHDHYLWFTIGEDMLIQWTNLKSSTKDKVLLADVVQRMKKNIRGTSLYI